MSSSSSQSAPSGIGRLTGLALGVVVFCCIVCIGLSVYVKYELDRTEAAIAAPESDLSADEAAFARIRRDLGYGGFLGSAQNFAATRAPALLPDMKQQLKQAQESFGRMPDEAAAETRHDLQSMLASFDAVMQKAEKSAGPAPAPDFSAADLVPLYAAVPVLDADVNSALASARGADQERAQFLGTLLMLISWGSLVAAAILAAVVYLTLRGRNSAPMRALAQSVKNMARGDMRTAIWGMERTDSIGDLARAVDQARFHFSQLPDMSLLSEQGPVRIRFEGNTRSLFEAMIRVISRDSEQVHEQANRLTDAVTKQQDVLGHVIERVESVLQNVESRAVSGDQQVRQALQSMVASAESLKHAQEHASDQLNRILPFLQERSQGIADIAQITGKQIAQTLQSLVLTERGLKASAEQSEAAIRKFSSTSDTLGERMFGAVNLLQAGGKVLAETTEMTQSRLNEAISRIAPAAAPGETAAPGRLETAIAALEATHARLKTVLSEQSDAARAQIELLTTQSNGLLTQTAATAQTLSSAADRLREEQAKLGQMLNRAPQAAEAAPMPSPTEIISPLLDEVRQDIASIAQGVRILHGQIEALQANGQAAASAAPIPGSPAGVSEEIREQWFQMAAQIEATRSSLAQTIMQQADRIEAHIAGVAGNPAGAPALPRDAQTQMEQQTLILNELVATLGLLDAHMQELRSQVSAHQLAG